MKYDAACVSISTGAAQTTPADGNGYQDTGNNCTSAHGLAPAALPNAIPIVDVAETSAKQYCASIGAHLLTNNECMTIARNAEGQASNWTGGSVGTGALPIGNANNASEYPADPNDANGYSNGTGGTMAKYTPTLGSDQKRTLLSDGSCHLGYGGQRLAMEPRDSDSRPERGRLPVQRWIRLAPIYRQNHDLG